jgi:formylglycine-generating enzyme required for sulfatase activity
MMIRTVCRVLLLSLSLGLFVTGAATAGLLPKSGEAQYELEFWESIKNSTHAEDYKAYLQAYPDGRFAALARARAARYAESSPPAAPPAPPVEEMDIHYEAVSNANVRKEPSSRAELVGGLNRGERVHVTGRTQDKNWFRIELAGGGTGFVYRELIREPVAAPAPVVSKPAPAPVVSKPRPAPPTAAIPEPAPVRTPVVTHQTGSVSDCDNCPEMVVLQPGSLVMGDNRGDRSERPAHRVTITKPFAIGKYEITLAQWNACVQAEACKAITSSAGLPDKSPAKDISWTDAQRYVQWLSKLTGRNYRLPTEAEWEYAARAGTGSRYWWGETMAPGKADCKGCGGDWSNDAPADVDAFPANPFGLYGMNGGVWEWVEDCWHKDYAGAPTDGSAWTSSDCRENVIRGGSWRNDSTYAHSASRFTYDTAVRYILNGLRVAKTLP